MICSFCGNDLGGEEFDNKTVFENKNREMFKRFKAELQSKNMRIGQLKKELEEMTAKYNYEYRRRCEDGWDKVDKLSTRRL